MNRLFRSLRLQASRVLSATQASVSTPEPSPAARGIVSNGLRPLALEQRFMFDGAAVATVADALHPDAAVHLPDVPAAVEVRAADPSLDHGKKEVVVVDTSVADYKTLEAGIAAGLGIIEIDGSKDGLAQLAKWAQGQSGYDSISILSHGSEAALHLGSATITEASLKDSAVQTELATLGQALTADGDLLLYGCDIAKDADGTAFIADIAKATGADVAASSDATGSASMGGNWVLEKETGQIDAPAMLNDSGLAGFSGLLATVTFVEGSAEDLNIESGATSFARTIDGATFTFANGSSAYAGSYFDIQTMNGIPGDGFAGVYALSARNAGGGVDFTITVQNGYTFDLTGFNASASTGLIRVYYNGMATYKDFNLGAIDTEKNLSSLTDFNDVTSVTFTSENYALFQSLVITDVKHIFTGPSVSTIGLSADTGFSGTDFITNTASQTLSGSLSGVTSTGEIVQVSLDSGSSWTTASNAIGAATWSLSGVTLQSGAGQTIQVRVTNTTDSSNSAVRTQSYTLDTNAPTISAPDLSSASDSGSSNTDNITQTTTPTFTGTAEAGSSVTLYEGSTVLGTATADGFGNWSIASNTLSEGSHTLTAKATDAAGNDSAVSSGLAITIDTTAPTTTVSTVAFSNDTGSSSTDFITHTASQTVSGTLSANLASGEIVKVSLDNGSTWTAATTTVGSNAWSLSGQTLSSSNTLKVKVTDAAGNDGTVLAQAYALDTTAPTTTFSNLALSADTGSSNTDFITRTAAQTITATLSAAPAGSDTVYGSLDNGATWTDITSKVSGTTLSWNGVTLSGSNTLKVKVTDVAGNDGTVLTQAYVLDTTAPTITFSNLALSADTGSSNTDFITRTAAQTITATLSAALAGSDKVYGSLDNGATWTDITSKVSGSTLTWNGVTLAGSNTFILKVQDAAGNDGVVFTQVYTLDTTAPTSSAASAAFSNDSGTSANDFVTNTASQTISGTLSANLVTGETVYVSLDNGASWTAAAATVGQNTWSLAGITLAGSNTLKVKVTDVAGNDGTVLTQAYVLDTTAPTITFSNLALSADTGSSNTDFITRTAAQTITATLSAALAGSDKVYGSLDNGATWTDITSKVSGTTLTWNGLTLAGSNTLLLRVTDAAGNDGTSTSRAYTLDAAAPATPSTPVLDSASDTGMSNSDGITSDSTPTFTGSAENGSTVTLYDGATLLGTVTAGSSGWSFTSSTLADGNHTITATATDAAGNVSAASSGRTLFVDTTAPAITSVSAPASGTYYAGGALDFTVNFNEAVTVDTTGGTPRIAMVVGSTTRYANYLSGSGTSALTFRYVVPSGDSDSNGVTVGALALNGGFVKDTAGNDATLTLNSVGSTAGVNVDGSQPSIVNVSASTADGTYGSGQSITVTVDFSSAVTVDTSGGTPTLALGDGGSASYSGGSGSTTLSFTYTVAAGQNSADLDYASTSALILNGATIVETGGSHQSALLTLATPGSAGSLGANRDIVIDSVAPTAPILVLDPASDSGSSNTDNVTNQTTPTITGTAEANSTVTLYDTDGTTVLSTTTADGSGNWSITSSTLTDGSHNLTAKASDAAGNVSAAGSLALTVDTAAPAAPTLILSASSDSGASSTDRITNVTTPTLTGTAEANSTVTLYEGGTVLGTTTADGSGNWSIASSTLTDGSHSLTAKASDTAGNVSAAGSLALTVDTAAPATPTLSMSAASDSGASSTDRLTNVTTPTITGTAEANSTVTLYDTDGTTVLGTTTADGSGNWSITCSTLIDGSHSLTTRASDAAGNVSVSSSVLSVTVDTAAPISPTLNLSAASDSGSSSSDRITKVTTPTITGTAEAHSTVTLYEGSTVLGTTTVDGSGNWSITSSTLTDGSHNLTAKASDTAGNVSAAGSLALTVDTAAPAAPTLSLSAASDSGASNTDRITNVTTPTITGTAEAHSTVTLYEGSTVLGTTTADGSGNWSIASSTLTDGSHSLTAKASDAAGNVSAAGSLALTVDTAVPATPTLSMSAASDSGASNTDRLTNVTTPTITGTAEAHSTVTLYEGGTVLGTTTADASGAWSITSSTLTDGSHNLTAKASDVAGNVSAAGSLALTVDTAVPATPTLSMSAASDSGASSTDRITNVTTPTITGTAEANSTVTLYEGSSVLGTATADTSGVWSITSPALADGSHNLTAKASDTAGNMSAAGSLALTVDTAAPAAPTLSLSAASDSGASNTDRITNVTTPTITGTAEAHSTVTLYEGSTVLGTTTADASGAWSITSPVLADGSHSLTAKASDAAGNVSAAGSLALTVDTAASAAPTLNLSASSDSGASNTDRITSATTPTITGTAEAHSTVTLYEGGTVLGTTTADASGAWSIASSTLTDGSHSLTAKAIDTAGNVSAAGSLALTVDTAVPATPTLSMSAASDSGASSTDRITKVTTPTITGTAEAHSTVTLYEGSTVLGTTTVDASGAWSITSSTLTDGSHSLTARASDAAGNISAAGSLALTVDTAVPATPTLSMSAASDSGASNTDRLTNVTTPTLTGTAEANSSVTLYEGSTVLGTTTADASGAWSITSSVLADGSHSLTAKATDTAGNVSGISSTLSVTVDTAAPVAPTLNLSASSDSGSSSSDRVTKVTTPTITGTAEAGSTVTLFEGSTVLGTATADGSGAWAIKSSALTDGSHSLSAKAIDMAGNISVSSAALSLVIDTASPTAVISLSNDALKAGEISTLTISFSEAVSDLTNAALTVQGGTLSELSSTDGGKTWTATFTPTVDLTSTSNVISLDTTKVSDLAGNAGTGTTNSQVFSIDTHSPTNTPSTPSEGSSSSTSTSSIPIPSAPSPSIEPAAAPISFLPASSMIGIRSSIAESVSTLPSDVSIGKSASAESSVRAIEQMPVLTAPTSPLSDSVLAVNRGVPDLKLSETGRSEISIPADAFAHSDSNAKLSFSLSQADGSALPSWVQFDQASGKLIVQAPEGYEGVLEIRVIARDSKGHEAVTTFHIVVGKAGKALERAQPAGRAGLSEQIHKAAHRSGGLRERLVAFAQTDELALRRRA